MSISPTKGGGWSVNETLTSAQITAVDANISNAVDKTAAGDTIAGPIVLAGGSASFTAQAPVVVAGGSASMKIDPSLDYKFVSAKTVTRVMRGGFANTSVSSISNNPDMGVGTILLGPSEQASQAVEVPSGAIITAFDIGITPTSAVNPGGGSSPTVQLKQLDTNTGTITTIGAVTSDVTSVGYNSYHRFGQTGLTFTTLDPARYMYFIRVGNESGGGAQQSTVVAAKVTFTTLGLDAGAG